MQSKCLDDSSGETWAIMLRTGEEVIQGLRAFVKAHKLFGSQFTAIGAFSDVTLGFFELDKKEYKKIPVNEQVEVVSLYGDFWIQADEPELHAYAIVAKSDGSTVAGHLLEAHVRPVLEVILVQTPPHIYRKFDRESGLALIDFHHVEPVL